MSRKSIAILLSLVFALLSTSAAFANSDPEAMQKKVIKETILTAESGSEILKQVKLEELSDGSYRKSFSGSIAANEGPFRLKIDIDKDKKTYKATRVEDISNEPDYSTNRSPLWARQLKMKTYDPPGWELASTKVILYFYEANGYAVYSSGGHAPYAANPSPLGTHWYIDSDDSWETTHPTISNAVGQEAIGSYSNYDFLEDDQWTYVNHDVSLYGFSDGSIDYDGFENVFGEGSALLGTEFVFYAY